MTVKRAALFCLLMLILLLAACSGQAETVTVEVTRVVTETVEVEGEPIEVTRIVTETVAEEATAEEEMAEDTAVSDAAEEAADSEMANEAASDLSDAPGDVSAVGSEDATGDVAPTPPGGPKVDEQRSDGDTSTAVSEVRAVDASDTNTVSIPGSQPIAVATVGPASQLTAGELDDNANWDAYLAYLDSYADTAVLPADVSERHLITISDAAGQPVLGAAVQIVANGRLITSLQTPSNGRVQFHPRLFDLNTSSATVNVTVNSVVESFDLPLGGSQRDWTLIHPAAAATAVPVQLDVLILLDSTGSMRDEIQQLKDNIAAIYAQIMALPSQPDVRFALVAYRDRGEDYLTRTTDFTADLAEISAALTAVRASGGGDYPEDLHTALDKAINDASWRGGQTVSLIFLVADAPPHLDYDQPFTYVSAMQAAAAQGIKLYPIASSGLNAQGEYIFRQLAQVTGGRFIFLTDEQPAGNGRVVTDLDTAASAYTVAALDTLVIQIITQELAFLP